MSEGVRRYFERRSVEWNELYRSGAERAFNKVLRKGVYARADLALDIMRPAPGRTLLDLGCGSGVISVAMAKRGASVTGIDFSAPMLQIARAHAAEEGVDDRCEFVEGDALELELEPGRFDGSFALGVFDYASDPARLLSVMRSVTSGPTVASFPSRSLVRAPLRKIRYRMRGCPVYFFTRRQLETLYAEAGFDTVILHERSDGWIVETQDHEAGQRGGDDAERGRA